MKTRISGIVLVLAVLLLAVAPASAAIVTLEFASFGNGIVTVTFDYNQGNGNVLRFTCTNNSDFGARFRVLEDVGGALTLRYEKLCPAHGVTRGRHIPGLGPDRRWPYNGSVSVPGTVALDAVTWRLRRFRLPSSGMALCASRST